MGRRRFDHLVIELSLALGRRVPRYDLWLRVHDNGLDPERLSRESAVSFCRGPLSRFLADHGLRLSGRARRRLERSVRRYDPALPTPYERMASI